MALLESLEAQLLAEHAVKPTNLERLKARALAVTTLVVSSVNEKNISSSIERKKVFSVT